MDETKKLAEDIINQYAICYAWNISFKFYYATAMCKKECVEFVARMNECKGGEWEVHTKGQYLENHGMYRELSGKPWFHTSGPI